MFHWPPSELGRLTIPQLLRWHAAARRIASEAAGK